MKPTKAIEARFELASTCDSDIKHHVGILRSYGLGCRHITEFGVRSGISTAAWLASYPDELHCYDRDVPVELATFRYQTAEAGIHFTFHHVPDTADVVISPTDLLFIDTMHCAAQCERELRQNAQRVRRYLIFHDTHTYGWTGDDGKRGLKHAIMDFMCAWPEWALIYHSQESNGLIVLERQEQ